MMNLKPVSKDVVAAVAFFPDGVSFQVTDDEIFLVQDGKIIDRNTLKHKPTVSLSRKNGKWSIEESIEVETLPDGTRRIVT